MKAPGFDHVGITVADLEEGLVVLPRAVTVPDAGPPRRDRAAMANQLSLAQRIA